MSEASLNRFVRIPSNVASSPSPSSSHSAVSDLKSFPTSDDERKAHTTASNSSSPLSARPPAACPTEESGSSLQRDISRNVAGDMERSKLAHEQKPATEKRRCWICFGEDDDSDMDWIKPCQCSLISHEQCLLSWITENQKKYPLKQVLCPQCNSPYYLSEERNLPVTLLGLLDTFLYKGAPYLMVLGIGCSVLVTATTYGVFAVHTMFGAHETERLLGTPGNWSWRTWLGVPSIPAVLLLSRTSWADRILPFVSIFLLRTTCAYTQDSLQVSWPPSPTLVASILPWIRLAYADLYAMLQSHVAKKLIRLRHERHRSHQPSLEAEVQSQDEAQQLELLSAHSRRNSIGVKLVSVLIWPSASSIIGSCLNHVKLVRHYFPTQFHRSILGGCLFVLAKDITRLFYRYERLKQLQSRRVRNYSEIKQQEL